MIVLLGLSLHVVVEKGMFLLMAGSFGLVFFWRDGDFLKCKEAVSPEFLFPKAAVTNIAWRRTQFTSIFTPEIWELAPFTEGRKVAKCHVGECIPSIASNYMEISS